MSVHDMKQEVVAIVRDVADQIFKDVKGPSTSLFSGPSVPFRISELSRRELAGVGFGVLRLSHSLQAIPMSSTPFAASIAFAPAILHTGDYGLYNIGLNPRKVLERGEWHRIVTSQLINATAVQLLDNANDLYESGSWLEKRWGWQGLVGAVGAVASLGPTLYVALTAFANRVAPSSALAQQYHSSYFVSPSMIALGISVLSGYDKDIYTSSRGGRDGNDQVWASRYTWGGRLLMTTFLAPSIFKDVSSHMEANICGILAGLITAYAFGAANPLWRRRGGLGVKDLAIQGALLGLLGLASYVNSKNAAIRAFGRVS